MPRSNHACRWLPDSELACRRLSPAELACRGLPDSEFAFRRVPPAELACRGLPDSELACRRMPPLERVPEPEIQPLGPWEAVHLVWQHGLIDPVGDGRIAAQEIGARNHAVLISSGGRPVVHAKQIPGLPSADRPELDFLRAATATRISPLTPRYLGWSGPPLFAVLTEGIDGVSGASLMRGEFPAAGLRAVGRSLAQLHSQECLAEFPCVTRRYLPTFFLALDPPDIAMPPLALPLGEERLASLLEDDRELPRPDRLRDLLHRWTATSLMHADLRLRHVFIRHRGDDFGVVLCDWEDVCIGDGIFDVGCLAASIIVEWYEGGLAIPEADLRIRMRSFIEGYCTAHARFNPCTYAGYTGVALIQALVENQGYWTDEAALHIWALGTRLVNDMDSVEIQRLIGAVP